MKTYKELFLSACEQIADEYESEKGHFRCMKSCPMCSLYNNDCFICGINYKKKIVDCIYQRTAKYREILSNGNVKSSSRANFYRQLMENAALLPISEFRPSATKRPNSKLLHLVKQIDKVVNL